MYTYKHLHMATLQWLVQSVLLCPLLQCNKQKNDRKWYHKLYLKMTQNQKTSQLYIFGARAWCHNLQKENCSLQLRDINGFLNHHISPLNLFSRVHVIWYLFFPLNVTLKEQRIHAKSNSEFVFRIQNTRICICLILEHNSEGSKGLRFWRCL